MGQLAWILDHQRDLAADFRAIYHLSWTEALQLPGPELMGLAYRVSAYPGVMRYRITQTAEAGQRYQPPPGTRVVGDSKAAILADPQLGAAISFG